ncbi:MAG: hypothetical protein C4K49_07950 [Candidatus Thorarchaeota archaeon]|nr:MAG: hypothetical protein C4K49_07950 [Candidatus Thorarchaeota archaeon]
MSWLAKIVNGTPDEFVHAKLVKYGIGTHPGPSAVIGLSQGRITFKADFDHEKMFAQAYLKFAPAGTQKVTGTIITYTDRRSVYEHLSLPLSWTKTKGEGASVFKAKISEVAPIEDLRALLDVDDPTTFLLLSMTPRDGTKPWSIATKSSFPKASFAKAGGKPDEEKEKPEEVPDEDKAVKPKDPTFAKGAYANTPDIVRYLLQEAVPDVASDVTPKTKDIRISNEIVIEEIMVPEDSALSFSEKRRMAKKKGKLVRRITIDGKEHIKEFQFVA